MSDETSVIVASQRTLSSPLRVVEPSRHRLVERRSIVERRRVVTSVRAVLAVLPRTLPTFNFSDTSYCQHHSHSRQIIARPNWNIAHSNVRRLPNVARPDVAETPVIIA
eukprot:2582034-Rhodomonas_salina.1